MVGLSNDPNRPMTAKLARVREGGGKRKKRHMKGKQTDLCVVRGCVEHQERSGAMRSTPLYHTSRVETQPSCPLWRRKSQVQMARAAGRGQIRVGMCNANSVLLTKAATVPSPGFPSAETNDRSLATLTLRLRLLLLLLSAELPVFLLEARAVADADADAFDDVVEAAASLFLFLFGLTLYLFTR